MIQKIVVITEEDHAAVKTLLHDSLVCLDRGLYIDAGHKIREALRLITEEKEEETNKK